MFGSRRRRGSSNPPFNPNNASPNAATAAAQAFLKNQVSNASLASAAAGAALRSRPTTPISVADVQTKRMVRRAGSTSSMGSSTAGSVRGPPGAALERRGSNSSMSERTFRETSPSPHVPSAVDAPPVPALPKTIPHSNSHRRTASLETPAARIASPPPNMPNGRGSSLGPRQTGNATGRLAHRVSSQSSIAEHGRYSDGRGSVNFSLPTSRRVESPVDERRLTDSSLYRSQPPRITSPTNQNLVYDPNTRSFLPYTEVLAIEQRMHDVANRPVKKKKRIAPAQSTGTHLSEGTMGRPHGSAVNAIEAASHTVKPVELPVPPQPKIQRPLQPPVATLPKKKKKKEPRFSDTESDQGSYMPNSSDNDSDATPYNARTGTTLVKKPSIVREDRDGEEREDDTRTKRTEITPQIEAGTRTFSPSPPLPRSAAGRAIDKGKTTVPPPHSQEKQQTRAVSQPLPESKSAEAGNEITPKPSVRGGRVQSISPARTAHFATSPDNLMVKHQPPGRSVSPRKSAMKNSNLGRDNSPGGDLSGNDAHSGSVIGSDDSPMPRKKAVRVSFDDSNVVVGEAAGVTATDSPVAPSPQVAKRNWFSLGGRAKKKDTNVLEDEDDEIMKPRPALPSFGSVRGRNVREQAEERPLVKPTEYKAPPTIAESAASTPSSPPLITSPTGEAIEYPMGQSSDHAVGAVLAQENASRNEANTSRSREPLPPQVTSVEGSGYHSDTDSTMSVLDDTYKTSQTESDTTAVYDPNAPSVNGTYADSSANTPSTNNKQTENIPQLSFTEPTPVLEAKEWLSMPGGFPEGASDAGSIIEAESQTTAEHHITDLTPSIIGIAEPYEGPHPGAPAVGDVHTALEHSMIHSAINDDAEDSDTTSIYCDAAEDLSDLEGDGFQSLNAVVESPVSAPPILGLAISTPPVSPTPQSEDAGPEVSQGWSKAQEYWSGLSAEKKRQLELDARDEEGDSESTIEAKPAPKMKKRIAAIAPATAVQLDERPQPFKHDRTYMIQPGTRVGSNEYTSTARTAKPTQHDAHIRKSMRAGEPSPISPDTQIRNSMRSQNQLNGTMRGSGKVEPRTKQRPMSLPGQITPDPAAVQMHIKALTIANSKAASKRDSAPVTSTSLRRRGSGDSDSSFKRAKPAEVTTMRRSMRTAVDGGSVTSPNGSSRFSLRSMSPPGSSFGRRTSNTAPPVSMLPETHMRRSMRNSEAPSLRPSSISERAKSPMSFPGFGRAQSAKPAKQKPMPTHSSRFADSSDEDEPRQAFQSRFVDSSDDEDDIPQLPKQNGLRSSMRTGEPVRPIPRKPGVDDGDSSDLPDSDDEKAPQSPLKLAKSRPSPNLGTNSIRRSGSGREAMSPVTETPRPTQSRRGSFLSILKRKQPDQASRVRKSDAESPARRDTPLERSRSDLASVRRNSSCNSTNGVSSPKLQKRTAGNWPLTEESVGDDEKRPFTANAADGVMGSEKRPEIGTRRSTVQGVLVGDAVNLELAPQRKKKKFQALRRMFKLDD